VDICAKVLCNSRLGSAAATVVKAAKGVCQTHQTERLINVSLALSDPELL
jgi:hypothetical protein